MKVQCVQCGAFEVKKWPEQEETNIVCDRKSHCLVVSVAVSCRVKCNSQQCCSNNNAFRRCNVLFLVHCALNLETVLPLTY